jgi:hypothetical protein
MNKEKDSVLKQYFLINNEVFIRVIESHPVFSMMHITYYKLAEYLTEDFSNPHQFDILKIQYVSISPRDVFNYLLG